MFERWIRSADPFEGVGARRRQLRLRIESSLAFGLAIVACGLTAAMWLRLLVPHAGLLIPG